MKLKHDTAKNTKTVSPPPQTNMQAAKDKDPDQVLAEGLKYVPTPGNCIGISG